jgi:hypothetical protein
MNIQSKSTYPACALSNFSPHPFVFDDVPVNSLEGLLQAFKFSNVEMQKEVCKLVGFAAKQKGANKNWKTKQTLYWQGREYARKSQDYQDLLERAYSECARQNEGFRRALLATRDAVLTHTIGKTDETQTILTRQEFCGILTRLRERLKDEDSQ